MILKITIRKTFLLFLILTSCSLSNKKYKDITSSKNDIEFYNLVKVEFQDDITSGSIYLPSSFRRVRNAENKKKNLIFFFEDFNRALVDRESKGYIFSVEKFESKNTQKLTDKQYIDVQNNWFQNEAKGDLNKIENLLSPTMKNAKVVNFEANLKINDKFFAKRISYFEDINFIEGVNCTNYHFVTVHNKRKYTFNINYYGNDKSVADLNGLFKTIGGSISFN